MSDKPLVDHLRDAKNWLNGGKCCGQRDRAGTCAAPACVFGEALKWLFEAADEIERQESMRHAAEHAPKAAEEERARLQERLSAWELQAQIEGRLHGEFKSKLGAEQSAHAATKARLEAVIEGMREFVRLSKSISTDIQTAHGARGDGASQWMREDDAELRRDFRKAVEIARALLSAPPVQKDEQT